MRTTIEIRDDQRAALLALAARRGEKGFSAIVGEAIAAYLRNVTADEKRREEAARVRGLLGAEEAADLEARTLRLRSEWR
jgi:hypothetical protein